MKTSLLMFARKSDFGMAKMALQSCPANWHAILVVSSEDYEAAKAYGFSFQEIIKSDFNRGMTLYGKDAIRNVCDWLGQASSRFERVVKLDADSLVFRPDYLMKDGIRAIAHPSSPAGVMGLCYSMPHIAAQRLRPTLDYWLGIGWTPKGEDTGVGAMALSLGIQDGRIHPKYLFWERYKGVVADKTHFFGHYRWRDGARQAGATTDEEITKMAEAAMARDFASLNLKRRD